MTDPVIPPEAVEAAAQAAWDSALPTYWQDEGGSWEPMPSWAEAGDTDRIPSLEAMRVGLTAALPHLRPLVEVRAKERVAEVLRDAADIHPTSILPGWFGHAANALFAAGVLHDEAATKAFCEVATQVGLKLGRQEALAEMAAEMALSEPWQWTDTRFRYVDVQIDKESWRQIMAARDTGKGESL